MAIKQPFMVKQNLLTAASSLSITAKPGESIRVKGLRSGALTSRGFTQVFIDRVSVGFFYTGDINANHLEQWSLATFKGNLLKSLIDKGIHKGWPVGEGQTFELRPYSPATQIQAAIEYEIGDPDDFKPDQPNGSSSKEITFLNYGTNGSDISANATGDIDTSRNPSEYPAFPFGEVVPAKQMAIIHGFALIDWKDSQGNLNPNYAYLKLIKDRITLFDEDRNGICVREGMGFLTWGPCRQTNVDIELFPEPLVFNPGDELKVQMTAGDTDIEAGDIDLCAIMTLKAIE
jgi:hypothetical protein